MPACSKKRMKNEAGIILIMFCPSAIRSFSWHKTSLFLLCLCINHTDLFQCCHIDCLHFAYCLKSALCPEMGSFNSTCSTCVIKLSVQMHVWKASILFHPKRSRSRTVDSLVCQGFSDDTLLYSILFFYFFCTYLQGISLSPISLSECEMILIIISWKICTLHTWHIHRCCPLYVFLCLMWCTDLSVSAVLAVSFGWTETNFFWQQLSCHLK